jgi:hypothetical protein
MKYNFNDLTFMIPVRIDSIIRIENLLAVIRFIRSIKARLLIYEISAYNNHIIEHLLPKYNYLKYRFIEDRDVVFYRTHYLNMMTQETKTPFVAIWDADVIVSSSQISESILELRENKADISFPYNGLFLDLGLVLREQYLLSPSINLLLRYKSYMRYLYGEDFVGGGIIVNRQKYIEAGMENEGFYGWGPEDLDRFKRWVNIGYKIHRAKDPMFHLSHPRDINGYMRSSIHSNLCYLHLNESANSSKKELIERLSCLSDLH